MDPLKGLRDRIGNLAGHVGEWAGIPMPLADQRLVVEPSYPWAAAFSDSPSVSDASNDGWTLRNSWYSHDRRCDILLMEKDGKIDWGALPAFHHLDHLLHTMACSDAWGLEQEARALELLQGMLRPRQFKQYLLSGMFLETSPRSQVTYLFRKLRPTIATTTRGDSVRILAALCMHPIAYYANSWAGAMCPTDDVIAHLSLMRGDEAMFWRRSNQHPAYRPEAGI